MALSKKTKKSKRINLDEELADNEPTQEEIEKAFELLARAQEDDIYFINDDQ